MHVSMFFLVCFAEKPTPSFTVCVTDGTKDEGKSVRHQSARCQCANVCLHVWRGIFICVRTFVTRSSLLWIGYATDHLRTTRGDRKTATASSSCDAAVMRSCGRLTSDFTICTRVHMGTCANARNARAFVLFSFLFHFYNSS